MVICGRRFPIGDGYLRQALPNRLLDGAEIVLLIGRYKRESIADFTRTSA